MSIELIIGLLIAVVGGIAGFFGGKTFGKKSSEGIIEEAKTQAQNIISSATQDGEQAKAKRIQQAKERFRKMKADADRELNQNKKRLQENERKLKQREIGLKQKENSIKQKENALEVKNERVADKEKEVEKVKVNLNEQLELLNQKKRSVDQEKEKWKRKLDEVDDLKDQLRDEQAKHLEKIAGLTADDAKQQLIDTMVKKAETEAMAQIKNIVSETKLKANKEAKKIIIQTIQRTAAEHTIENTVSVFRLESDDIKGQIIGREGRNIRALEAATGVEIIVDDTPEAIVISGYDPVRREIARLSLHRLVADGRIHPARIEEIVAKTRKQLDQQIIEIGERTVIDLNMHGMHPELIKIVGRMRFRSSYGQNLLQHSIETAKICAIMSSELGLSANNVRLAKRAGLLHDIGKVPHEETELSHALLGLKWTEKFGEHPAVCNAVGAHHDEIEMEYLISPIVQACDAISGARPGARREILESYLKRIRELEELALSYKGVEKAYAIQAGRELRVIVESDTVPDHKAEELSLLISTKIQDEMQYPGQIKVTVIREKRAISFAR